MILNSNLSREEIESFNKNGFLGPFKLYEPAEAKTLLRSIRKNNVDRSKVIFDNEVNYDRHFDIPELANHICHPGIIKRLQSLLGANILCWRTEFFPKFPGSIGTEWHQVANYQYANGTPMIESTLKNHELMDLTVWTSFTDATKENGCMKFLPGSYKKKYYDEAKPVGTGKELGYQSVRADTGFYGYQFSEFKIDATWEPNEDEAVTIEMQAGECIIFTARCVHASHPNITERSTRFAISSRYVPTHVRVYPDQNHFIAHGAVFDLQNYGSVLVSGQNDYSHNRIRELDNNNKRFLKL